MNSEITILHARKWSMIEEKTGLRKDGVSIHYVMTDRFVPNVDAETGELGYAVTKESLPLAELSKLVEVPGIYDAEFVLRTKAGKNVLVVSSVEFVRKAVEPSVPANTAEELSDLPF